MAERAILQLAHQLKNKKSIDNIMGTSIKANKPNLDYIKLPSLEEVKKDKKKFIEMFHIFYQNNDPLSSKGLYQKHNDKYLIQHH